jgi:ubiquitin C-terminal hydrolase
MSDLNLNINNVSNDSDNSINEIMPNLENKIMKYDVNNTQESVTKDKQESVTKDEQESVKESEQESEDDEKTDNEEEIKKGIVGLNNMGNTCYLNSVIQVLSNLDDFRKYLFDGNFVSSLKPELDESLFYRTYQIIMHLWKTKSRDLTPKSFRNKFVEKQKLFLGYEQQDSHEAMQFLLDNLHEEIAQSIDLNMDIKDELKEFFKICDSYYMNEMKDKNILKIIDENSDKALEYFALKYYTTLSKNYSEIADMFQSIVCNLTKCPNCNHMKFNFDNIFMLSLSFPELDDEKIKESDLFKKMFNEKVEEFKEKTSDTELITKFCLNEIKNKNVFRLSNLIDNFFKAEQQDERNMWDCEGCEQKVKALQQTKIYKSPKYLILHLKRFQHIVHNGKVNIFKVGNLVGYDEKINIKQQMIKNSDNNTTYKLVGGINHIGRYEGGHFTSFSKNNDKWYNFNDDRVNEINCKDIPISPNAYMLIYKLEEETI